MKKTYFLEVEINDEALKNTIERMQKVMTEIEMCLVELRDIKAVISSTPEGAQKS